MEQWGPSDKVNLTIIYNSGINSPFKRIPDMHVTLLGKEYEISDQGRLTTTLDKGEYDLLFTCMRRKKSCRISINGEKIMSVGFNRFWGTIEIKTVSEHVTI